eukprot:TRINITY_DN944_c1_g1_i1.p1 TRINITY_DN944_c1_g1~~TRINITY_DN944_c1_g1_i1.p1  ORF type:complete len:348 (-),score=22.19 TRINITY_DN944_c1_g1_i1:612-1655(-)
MQINITCQVSRTPFFKIYAAKAYQKPKLATKRQRLTQVTQPREFPTHQKLLIGASVAGLVVSGLELVFNPNLLLNILDQSQINVIDIAGASTIGGSLVSQAGLLTCLYKLKEQEEKFEKVPLIDLQNNFDLQALTTSGLFLIAIGEILVSIYYQQLEGISNEVANLSYLASVPVFGVSLIDLLAAGKFAGQIDVPWGVGACVENLKQRFSRISFIKASPYEIFTGLNFYEVLIIFFAFVVSPFFPLTGQTYGYQSQFIIKYVTLGSLVEVIGCFGALSLVTNDRKSSEEFRNFNYVLALTSIGFSVPTVVSYKVVDYLAPNYTVVAFGVVQALVFFLAGSQAKDQQK